MAERQQITSRHSHISVADDDLDKVVRRLNALTATGHMEKYDDAFFASHRESLHVKFPVLLYALGENLFGLFVRDFLQQSSSRGYARNSEPKHSYFYIDEIRPDRQRPFDFWENWPDFIIDLALMERAFNEVIDGPGVEGCQTLDADRSIQTNERYLETRFVPVVCLKLLAFRYPVSHYFTAVRKNEHPNFPERAETFLAVTRRDYVVCIHELTRLQYDVLSALVDGITLGKVVDLIKKNTEASSRAVKSTVFAWINDWADKGFFAGVEN